MNKSEFIDKLSTRFEGNRRAAAQALDAVVETITREVAGGQKVAITGFGAFEKLVRPARTVRNPQTGERIRAKKTSVPKFRPGANLKDVVSGAKKPPKPTVAQAATSGTAKRTATKTAGTAAKKSAAKKGTAKRSAAKSSTGAKKATARKSTAKTSPGKKTAAKSTARKTSKAAKSSPAKRTTAKKTAAKRSSTSGSTTKKAMAKRATAKKS